MCLRTAAAVSEVLSRVGDKWTVLVVSTLGDGPKRFNELRKALGSISQRMLTLTLRGSSVTGRSRGQSMRSFRRVWIMS
jgi:DNA-binding HxlR family transcriptional regulator